MGRLSVEEMTMPYTIEEHRRRFAIWTAGTAAKTRSKGKGLSVVQAGQILEEAGITSLIGSPDLLPEPERMEDKHRNWRHAVIEAAANHGLTITHGVAAKLINVFLKTVFVCGGFHEHPRVQRLHPPIDRILLDQLFRNLEGEHYKKLCELKSRGWSKFTSDNYENVISVIRDLLQGQPLWMIEQFWCGYQ